MVNKLKLINAKTIIKNKAAYTLLDSGSSSVSFDHDLKNCSDITVKLIASKTSGNGFLLVSCCGSRPQALKIIDQTESEYYATFFACNIDSKTIKVFRPTNGSGCVYIKSITADKADSTDFCESNDFSVVTEQEKLDTVKTIKIAKQQERERAEKIKIIRQREQEKISAIKIIKQRGVKVKYKQGKRYFKTNDVTLSKSAFPLISIITPTRDGCALLKNCYAALKANTYYPNWEWVIGDSASTDDTVVEVKAWNDPRVRLIERKTTEGSFSSINNELVEHALGEYLLFLNDDTQPQPFWLTQMFFELFRNENIGVVGAKLLYADNSIQHAGVAFIPQGPANLGRAALKQFKPSYAEHDRYLQAVTGACFLMRRADFAAVGGFDQVYHFCYEDIDLCLKVREQLNKTVLYLAGAKVYHLESVTQNKHKTSGVLQKAGIVEFHRRWDHKVDLDFVKLMKHSEQGLRNIDISFVTCVNNFDQYVTHVVGSLLKNNTQHSIELIPIINSGNQYSAAQALNIGVSQARGKIIVLCHQDVAFFDKWVEMLFERVAEIEQETQHWGVLGTAGITTDDTTMGVVYSLGGSIEWSSTKKATVLPVQTVDEHCMIIKKDCGFRFDENTFNGFHLYGADLCLEAASRGLTNYGILCPLIHHSSSASTDSGKSEFMRLLRALEIKWRDRVSVIRTPTSLIKHGQISTFIDFKSKPEQKV